VRKAVRIFADSCAAWQQQLAAAPQA